jgi:hypothetical protein
VHIPFETLADRHLVYAYAAVAILHAIYATWLLTAWRKASKP